ncbi:MAG TPA: transketolase [Candidatus Faecousia faecigallinarum]|nr:transketolase [Candidatus Faecousia faecigallinarum]
MTSTQLAWLIRRHGIEMTHLSGGSHIGAVLSVADILGVLYAGILHYDSQNPNWDGRDRLIMSKGHAGAAVYAALAESGFFDPAELKTHYANGSRLSGHVSHHLPGVDFSTGSLGHGLSAAAGMALAAKQDGKHHRVFAVLGDGECDEGAVWEAALFANHYRLENLVAVIDHNHMQSLDTCENTLELEDFGAKWRAFGWHVVTVDGHDHPALQAALADTRNPGHKPTAVIANTVKGKGVSFMENDILWHYRFPHDGWEYDGAVTQLHRVIPDGITDPYTPEGIPNPVQPGPGADIGNDHSTSAGWHPTYFDRRD